ncbi:MULTISPECIES: RNase adapter RapZ [Nocardia]|uniref:Nucleotide-binding protein NFA_35930 n=2 Tax=Nocardia farcinica TaxID=37329 RepID=Y3593_NOCFA|nr:MULTISPECIES: RNase adapter RapZ [Nocardia]Q5YTQ0.1 RecName: Full=Nucleotide-binding protein NFA_35930 [Nocardia farcinica IFM 10152]MCZ9325150.1 RNase adapter RapZ [Nocardia farcinica]PFX03808.1 Nucleotide-binding protein [Nocardia farcinica]PFX09966.1 Nucleotide-binding protein [Nocardia farcinica]UEX20992.1 RNase adapter RapZ [Nocardia farcinica]CRY74067.1 glmZ(sRNA)-inactivating NTPase [Nocardia farcinica]
MTRVESNNTASQAPPSGAGTLEQQVEVVIVTGLSGAGRGTAAKVLEDLGWYVADNLPPELIGRMVELGAAADPPIRRLALVMDVRSRFFTGDLSVVADQLRALGLRTRVLFLEASDDVLIRRFGFARRRHPLQSESADGTLSAGIAVERVRLAGVKAAADLVIDTTELSIHQLHRKLEEAYGGGAPAALQLTVQSFGFKYGVPLDADMVLDVRFLPNPHWIPELREHSGQETVVSEYVLSRPGAQDYLHTCHHLVDLTTSGYRQEGKRYMTVAVGCTGGKHRSVAIAEALGELIGADTSAESADVVRVVHRDLGRE